VIGLSGGVAAIFLSCGFLDDASRLSGNAEGPASVGQDLNRRPDEAGESINVLRNHLRKIL